METDFITWAREVKGMRGALPDTPENRQKLQVLQAEFEQSQRAPAPSALSFDDLPETPMTANPQLPATTQEPDSLSSLIPESNVFEELPAEEPAPSAPVAQGDMLRSVSEQRVWPVLQQWRQKFNEEVINGNHKTGVARAQKELDFNNRVVPQLVDLRSQGLLPPEVESVLTRYQERPSGFPLVESLTMAYDDFLSGRQRTPQGETGTTKDGSPTPIAKLKDSKAVLGETDPAVQQQQERVSRQIQQEIGFEIAGNRQEQRDIALAAANALTTDPVEGATKFETNLAKLEASQRVLRDNEDAQIAMLRGILGEDAGNSTNVRELVATLDDEQARQFASMKRKAGLSDMNPGAVVIRPGVMTNEENRRNLTNALQSNALVLEVREGKDGMKATSAYLTPESYRALMKEFADPEPGQAAPPSESEKLKQLQEVIKDPARPIVERASAQTEIAKIQKSLAQKGPNRSEEEVKAARQSRKAMLDEFKTLFDVTSAREPAVRGVFSPIKRNPALDDKTYEESLIRLEELAARLGGAKDGFISRRLPDLQRLRQLLNNPSD